MLKYSIILPVRDEEEALAYCIKEIRNALRKAGINRPEYEIVVSDSSSDSSPEIARKHKLKVVKHDRIGYGVAIEEGLRASKGEYIVVVDADGTYDYGRIPEFISRLEDGADFVIGDRFTGYMREDAMPWLHRRVGNPFLSWFFRRLFGSSIRDVHCGMRALRRDAYIGLGLKTTGMEYASEMVVKAVKNDLEIVQVPVDYRRRMGESKLRSFTDGFKHLRFMLLYSPFIYLFAPGLGLFAVGSYSTAQAYLQPAADAGDLIYPALAFLTGYQVMIFSLYAKSYAVYHLGETSKTVEYINRLLTIDRAAFAAFAILFSAAASFGYNMVSEAGDKDVVLSALLSVSGVQTLLYALVLSILGISDK